jgi:Ca2+-binding EF-hand superfamily protein
MTPAVRTGIVALLVVLIGACAREMTPASQITPGDVMQSIKMMQAYDTNHDGVITRDEVEEALKREFATVDANGDGRISIQEMQAENDRRWKESGPASSPLIDWSQDGIIDFAEFAGTVRSTFSDMDRNGDGRLEGNELRPPRMQGGRRGPGRMGRGGEPPR